MYRVIEIENALIERIRAAALPYLRFVGSYGGELSGNWDEVIRALPAVWVVFKGANAPRPLNTAQTRWRVELKFSTVAAARSPRSERAARQGYQVQGQQYAIGSYQLLSDVARLLTLHDCGLDSVDYFRPGAVRSLFNAGTGARALSVFAQDWSTSADFCLHEPCAAPLGTMAEGYLPEAGENAPQYEQLRSLALRYWLKPPQQVEIDPPAAEDALTLNIEV